MICNVVANTLVQFISFLLYRKQYRELEINHHHDTNPDISRCWVKPPTSKVSATLPHIIPELTKESCVGWNDEYRADPDNWGNLKLCTCHGKFLGDRENQDRLIMNSHLKKHGCAICTIASDLEKRENSDNLLEVVATRCVDTPVYDTSDLKGLPEMKKDAIRNIQQRFNKLPKSEDSDVDQNDTRNTVPFPSGYGGNRKSANTNSGKTSETYPHCGTPMKNACECIDGKKERDLPPIRKEPPHISCHTENETDSKRHLCRCQAKGHITDRPVTALKKRNNLKNVQFHNGENPQRLQQKSERISSPTKDHKFPVAPRTNANDLRHLTRKFNPKYWASDDSDISTFSDPPPNRQHVCEECHGITTNFQSQHEHVSNREYFNGAKDVGDSRTQRVHYLSPRGALPRNNGLLP